jgi:predicted alpha/beta hydrolase family esterase
MPYTYVYLAGLNDSGPEHWQRLWHEAHGGQWVDHADWVAPQAADWLRDLDQAVRPLHQPLVLVAHSLGALLAAQWLANGGVAAAAYLVAPPDANDWTFPENIKGFEKAASLALPCPSRVVASRDDPYSFYKAAEAAALAWGSGLWDMGERGHINAESGLGDWQEGWEDLQEFLKGLPA